MQKKMPEVEIVIRKYVAEDAESLANIFYNTIHQVNCKDYTPEQIAVWAPDSCRDVSGWRKKFARTQPFVAIAGNVVVGFAEFEADGHIDCFYCHHEWLGMGVGAALMKACFASAAKQGIKRIFAEVSITAKPFFERYGFVTVKEQSVQKGDVFLTNYKMEKLV